MSERDAARFVARTARFEGRIEIGASIEDVFPLFSPLGEKRWVPGWDPELLHPPGAEWEEGLIFRTREETGDAIWLVLRLDRAARRVAYHRVEPERYVARVEVECRALSDHGAEATVLYSFVGLSESGNREIAAMTREAYDAKMARWTTWLSACLRRRAGS